MIVIHFLENEFKELTAEGYLLNDSATVETTAYFPGCRRRPHAYLMPRNK